MRCARRRQRRRRPKRCSPRCYGRSAMRPTDSMLHPADWDTTTVGRSVEVKRGVSWSKEQEHSEPGADRVPVIGIRNVQDRLDLTDLLYLSGLRPAAVDKARVSAGWTVIVG